MEAKIANLHNMETLGRLIKSAFPVERIEVSLNHTHFAIYFDESVRDKAAQVKAVHDYVKEYVAEHGDPKEEYQFSFYRDRELIDILHFNEPDAAYYITMEVFGKVQNLRVQDVLGATGDYTIFNDDFEKLGGISAVGIPDDKPKLTIEEMEADENSFYSDHVYPDFSNPVIWRVEPDELKPYLNEILSKVLQEINSKAEPMEINIDDPEDVSFWAEQFELSEADLRKAVFAAGKSIDDITAYLQK